MHQRAQGLHVRVIRAAGGAPFVQIVVHLARTDLSDRLGGDHHFRLPLRCFRTTGGRALGAAGVGRYRSSPTTSARSCRPAGDGAETPRWLVWSRRRAGSALTGNGKLALADISRRGGGRFWPHVSHRLGLDADVRPVRRDGRQCRVGTTWRSRSYDRAATRALIWALRGSAHGRVDVILFNDPVLVRAGLTKSWPGHGDHLHVRYCSPDVRRGVYACHRHRTPALPAVHLFTPGVDVPRGFGSYFFR